jgi:ABC-type Fe3+/spermidine/putrescine transport system ATPase subunit
LMIRPEAIRVRGSTHTGANVLSGHIIRTVFAGRAIHYVVKLASGRLLNVIAPPHDAIEAGSAVTVELPAERLRPVGAKAI